MNMKLLGAVLLSAGCGLTAGAGELRIVFEGNRPDTIVVNAESLAERVRNVTRLDYRKYAVEGNSVSVPVDDSELMYVSVWPLDQEYDNLIALVGCGDSVTVTVGDSGRFDVASFVGTPLMDGLMYFRNALDGYESSEEYKAIPTGNKLAAFVGFKKDYVSRHLDEESALWMLWSMPDEFCSAVIDSIGEGVAQGQLQPVYEAIKDRVDDFRSRDAKKKRNQAGGPAPDFTLCDPTGREVSLSHFRGKWVLLDFWATWCKWCIKGFPEMETFRQKFGERCVVIGLSADYHRETWVEYLSVHPSEWLNLWIDATDKSENNPTRSYGIDSFPTKLLISPEGKIILYEVGENPAFYEKAASLIGE